MTAGAKKTTTPKAGTGVSVRVDEQFAEDLAILARAGMNTTDAVRWAVFRFARAFEAAWERGTVPEGHWPDLAIMVGPPKETPAEEDQKAA